ncbi:MAG: hypothetical protein IJS15_05410 [Victivallales bacterium]|nr:hypothetical protein [Victivallales bacterium]
MKEELNRLRNGADSSETPSPYEETKTPDTQETQPVPESNSEPAPIPAIPVFSPDDGAAIQLQAYSGKTMTITGDTVVNFTNTRGLNGDDFQFLDHNEQFRISRQGTKWLITPGMNTRNATMLNYLPLTGPEVLENDDTISISIPGSNVNKMTLTVKFLS